MVVDQATASLKRSNSSPNMYWDSVLDPKSSLLHSPCRELTTFDSPASPTLIQIAKFFLNLGQKSPFSEFNAEAGSQSCLNAQHRTSRINQACKCISMEYLFLKWPINCLSQRIRSFSCRQLRFRPNMVLMCIIFRKMKSLICKIKPGILYEYKEAVTNYFKELKLANSFD